MSTKRIIQISVREMVTFVLRTGDLGGSGHFVASNRALEGTRGHQRLQKSRPAGYEAEVTVSHRIEMPEFVLELKGRIDGVLLQPGVVVIEEIKTTDRAWIGPADPLHWAQAKIYAFIYSQRLRFDACEIQITYFELESGRTVEFREKFSAKDIADFFEMVVAEYAEWVRAHLEWCSLRDSSIKTSGFPFEVYRTGQRSLAVAVYRTLKNRGKLFAGAPTGIGKTISVLFPSLKALGEGHVEKIFYLTAKTIGRTVAEKALADLRSAGLRLRAVTITARDKICFNSGEPCDVRTCPFAIGYYDRIKGAIREALRADALTREFIERIARAHNVCPFELSLDVSLRADAIICDYNYAFDPSASLKRYFDGETHAYAILVDEAHNLVDRAREMFSADLLRDEIHGVKSAIATEVPGAARALARVGSRVSAIDKDESWVERDGALVSKGAPANLTKPLKDFLEEAERWLAQNIPASFRAELLDLYFRVVRFQRTLELYDDRYVSLFEKSAGCLRLFCVDPSSLLQKAMERSGAAVFFSATLRPGDYFREALGGGDLDAILQLNSPFPPENLCVLINGRVPTRLRARSGSYDAVVTSIAAMAAARTGNYLVYFPSYDYLAEVLRRFPERAPGCRVVAQSAGMRESERDRFLANFHSAPNETLVAFAVLGGIFGEGIDLVGERLIGVAIVGVGLPQICLERDLIREYCQARNRPGFDFAYTFPGMNRVLQAVGRVIRSETDQGVVLLIDERFCDRTYRDLFPEWWSPAVIGAPEGIREALEGFWHSKPRTVGVEL